MYLNGGNTLRILAKAEESTSITGAKLMGKLATHRYPRPAHGDNGGKPERAALQKVPGKDSETGEDIATLWCQLTMFDAI